MIVLSEVSADAPVADLNMGNINIGAGRRQQERYTPHSISPKTHKGIPLFLVADGCQARRNLVLLDNLCQLVESTVVGLDGFGKGEVACGVLVAIVHNGGVWERGKVLEGAVHLCACALKEATTASNEESISGEDPAWLYLIRSVSGVVAYRVLCVAGRCETS
jgi:hypothetical protein